MQFNPTSGSQGIVHEIDFLCDSDSTSYPTADKVRRVNAALEELIADIINADGNWQWDDTNHTDRPVATFTLVEGREDYALTTDYLQIEAVEILSSGSPAKFKRIKPLDHAEIPGNLSPEEYFGLKSDGTPATGFPEYWDMEGDTLFLYPAPTSTSVTLASGGRIWTKRTADLFTASDTTQEPGLPSTHHILLAYMAALPYNAIYHPGRVAWLERKIGSADSTHPLYGGMRKSLLEHFAHRLKAEHKIMRLKRIQYI